MTNPGQIDPGYNGPLHLTVINMSKEALTLSRGQRLIRLIYVRLDATPSADYQTRHPGAATSPITDELLQALSIDFLNVEHRASEMIKNTERSAGIRSAVTAAVVGIFVTFVTAFVPWLFDRYSTLESGLNTLAAKIDVATLKDRLDRLEAEAKSATAAPGIAPLPLPVSAPAVAPRP
jgi:hypothetical protein